LFALLPSSRIDAELDLGAMPVLWSQLQHQQGSDERRVEIGSHEGGLQEWLD
jgi:23S rRNA U2552 (ribose-2'-O)-methylase RlmE/FtsJ